MTKRRAEHNPNRKPDADELNMVRKCAFCTDPQVYLCDHVDLRVCKRRLCVRHAQVLDPDTQYCPEHRR